MEIVWTEYMKYRAKLRGFDFAKIKHIVQYSTERYYDVTTQRLLVIGHHDKTLVLVPYERESDKVTPVTIHAITRQQINFRLKMGRFRSE
ncbi:hypothetical protein KKG61_05430 [bacterium]|nr:hypothetical protein [bacterium]